MLVGGSDDDDDTAVAVAGAPNMGSPAPPSAAAVCFIFMAGPGVNKQVDFLPAVVDFLPALDVGLRISERKIIELCDAFFLLLMFCLCAT